MNTGNCEIRCNVFCLMGGVERIDIPTLQCGSQEIQGPQGTDSSISEELTDDLG